MKEQTLKEVVMHILTELGYGDEENGADVGYMSALYDVAEKVKALPTVTPQPKIEWIPVSERLPEPYRAEKMTKEDAKAYIREWCPYGKQDEIIKALERKPKTGHWIDKEKKTAVCSCCNRNNLLYGDFCKWCGAKMIEPQESEE